MSGENLGFILEQVAPRVHSLLHATRTETSRRLLQAMVQEHANGSEPSKNYDGQGL